MYYDAAAGPSAITVGSWENAVGYPRFERLVIGSTALFVGLRIGASVLRGGADPAEVVGELAFIFVAAAAVHWGRKAGTLAALAACIVYLALQLPLLAAGLSSAALLLIVSRMAGYCLVGIVGGEIFSRVKYVYARSSGTDVIDDWSLVYNQRFVARALEKAIERHRRYKEPFSVVILSLSPSLPPTGRPEQLRATVRTVASFLRDDVRMVDDVARIDDGRFVVLLPHTPAAATRLVAERLATGVCQTLGAKRNCISTRCLNAGEDPAGFQEFAISIGAISVDGVLQPASGE